MKIKVNAQESVTATRYPASKSKRLGVTLILGHGAGANQTSGFMTTFARAFAARGIDVVTFNFLYTEQGRNAPDRADKLEACYRAVIDAVRKKLGDDRLFIGGKSMGGRIASQVAAQGVEGLSGLVFLGYPLHPPGNPEKLRAAHLAQIKKPMLFVQGERDTFGTPDELRPIIKKLKPVPKIYPIALGDHSFAVPKKAGSQEEIYMKVQGAIVEWMSGF
jgi:predicted alpha/beta-hydrolase family hydrolase